MSGETWADLFTVLIYGEGAFVGLMIVAVLGVIAISKAREIGVVFIIASAVLAIQVISSAGDTSNIIAAFGYVVLIPLFLIMMFSKKSVL